MKKSYGCVGMYGSIFSRWQRGISAALVFSFCLAQLSGCGVVSRKYGSEEDGAPKVDIDVSKIKDAVPKAEPYHPYGTRNYTVWGRHYKVLKNAKGYVKKGYASWYGSKFHGEETSTQEKFSLYGMTAASPHLPLPTYVQVTNLLNGKKVVVRVNDRGPFHSNRILDLSYAAAKKLDFVNRGVAPVKIVAIDPKTWGKGKEEVGIKKGDDSKTYYAEKGDKSVQNEATPAPSKKPSGFRMFLQIGAFTKLANAKQLYNDVNKCIKNPLPVHIEHKADLYRVQIGPLADSTQIDKLKLLLEKNGIKQVNIVEG